MRLTKYEVSLIVLFLLTLPLSNPWVRGDGVGYYAFARSMLIEHRLDFTKDWLNANGSFRMDRIDDQGHILPSQYTVTGHLNDHFSIGPALLWSPFLIVAHAGVLSYDALGGHVAADGYSRPYLLAMAFGTAFYGFLAVLISFALARRYVSEQWAFLAAIGIWFGSSLPVYMYFNPSWSHAQSAFSVALFIWYWLRSRGERNTAQWAVLGALGGLMIDVYYVNAVVLLLPLLESLGGYPKAHRGKETGRLLANDALFCAMLFATFLPTLIVKKVIYGGYLRFGYTEHWYWNSPAFFKVCFSSDHGLFTWTPILILAVAGLYCLRKHDRQLAFYSIAVFVGYLYAMGCYENWHGISSFGSRFFVGLTALFILGLAALFDWFAQAWRTQLVPILGSSVVAILILWNLAFIFQWGMHLIPDRGPISWRKAIYNQVAVVPEDAASSVKLYFTRRKSLMQQIEQTDINQLKSQQQKERD